MGVYYIGNQDKSRMPSNTEEYLSRCVVDTLARKFYLYSNEGGEKVVECETVEEFMNVLEVVRTQVDEETLVYSNPFWNMKTITVEELQNDFDSIMEQVEEGHQFIIESKSGNVLLMPYKIYDYSEAKDDLTKIHTDHEEGSWQKVPDPL